MSSLIWIDGSAADSEKDCLTGKIFRKLIHYLTIINQAPLQDRFLAGLYESTGRAIALSPVSASASASASALTKC